MDTDASPPSVGPDPDQQVDLPVELVDLPDGLVDLPDDPVDLPDELVDLPDGRRLIVREGRREDAEALHALYRRLSVGDLSMRFFTAAAPSASFLERWLTIGERGGLVLVAVVADGDEEGRLVAEAGYSLLSDGDGELGITVDPAWRGWLGPWLLDLLLRRAAARGVPNLQAVVRLGNRRMLALLRHRGSAIVEQDPPDEIRIVIGAGATPTWPVRPSGERPLRVLVEAAAGHWAGEAEARRAGFDVRTCRGPSAGRPCPVLDGGRCALVDGADVVVVLRSPLAESTDELIDAHRSRGSLEIVVPELGCAGTDPAASPDEVIDQLRRTIGVE